MTMASFEDLKSLNVGALKSIYDDAPQDARSAEVGLPGDLIHRRHVDRRRTMNMLAATNAAKSLDGLPAAGEAWHIIMAGNWHAWGIVPAILRLAAPAKIKTLHIATLGFNRANAEELTRLLDSGDVGSVAFVCSVYFRDTSGDDFAFLREQLKVRGQRIAAVRCHAKLIVAEMTDGRAYVVESSANLRSCRNIEQMTISHDRALLEFHVGWISRIIEEANQ